MSDSRWAAAQRKEIWAVNGKILRDMAGAGLSVRRMAQVSGLSRDMVGRIMRENADKKPAKELISLMRAAREPALAGGAERDNKPEAWQLLEEMQDETIRREIDHCTVKLSFLGDRPIGVAFVGDQHIAPGSPVDWKRLKRDAETICETDGLYAVLLGDGVDNHLKHTSALLAARSDPTEQYELFAHYLTLFGDKLLVVLSGNHDYWSHDLAGVDVLKLLCDRDQYLYTPHHAFLEFKIGKQEYRVLARHQARGESSRNLGNAFHRLWEDLGPFEVGVLAHRHIPHISDMVKQGSKVWCLRPGTYQIYSDYGRKMGYAPSLPGCPVAFFWGDQHRVYCHSELDLAARQLEDLRLAGDLQAAV